MKRKYLNNFAQADFMRPFSEIAAYAHFDMLAMKRPKCWIHNEHIGQALLGHRFIFGQYFARIRNELRPN